MKIDDIVDFPSLITARSSQSAELVNDVICVFGGLGIENAKLRTVERYDLKVIAEVKYHDFN